MARARNIKPGFFRNADLVELSFETRLLFIGLWTLADREGRLEDRPKQIKMELFPADQCDVGAMLDQLQATGFVKRYEIESSKYIEVVNFIKHQDPHYKEKASEIPPPPGKENFIKANGVTRNQRQRILERDQYTCQSCGSADNLCIDHVMPVSRGGDSSDENLQVLCGSCNTKKGNKINGEEKNSRQRRVNIDPNLNQRNGASPSDSLIPESLLLNPESLIPEPNHAPDEPAKRARADYPELFDEAWDHYPPRQGANKRNAFKAWSARVKAGVDPSVILQGVKRYADYCKASGTEPRYIKHANTFFGPDEHYLSDWTPPARASPRGESEKDRSRRETYEAMTGKKHEPANERIIDAFAERVD